MIETAPVDAGKADARGSGQAFGRRDAGYSGFTLKPLYIRAPDAVPPTPLVARSFGSP